MSEESVNDPLALGLGSLAAGIGFGGAWMTAAQIALSLGGYRYESVGFYALTAGLVGAVGIAGASAWYRTFTLDNVWQRGVISVLAAVGAILVGFLAAVVERFFGVIGMVVWMLLSIAVGILATRWAIRGRGPVTT